MRTHPDRVHTALNALTESTLRFIDALKRYSVVGIYYAIQHASYDMMSEDEYRQFGLPYDRKIMEALPEKWWLNVLHLHGDAPMFKLCNQLPAHVINWHDQETEPDLAQGRLMFNGAVCGGLSRWKHILHGTPNTVREQARTAMKTMNNRRFILSSGCAIMVTSPLSNIRAVREVVDSVGA
jgi:uroporphyrinogen decarboxylase